MAKFPAYDRQLEKLNALRKDLSGVLNEAGSEYDMDQVKSVEGSRTEKVEWIRAKNKEIEEAKRELTSLDEIHGISETMRAEHIESGAGEEKTSTSGTTFSSLGDAFVKSRAFKNYQQGSGTGPVASVVPDLKTLFQTTAGWEPESTRSGVVTLFPTRPAPHVVDAIPSSPVSQAAYLFMEETTFTNNAAETAEASTYPEAALELTERTQTVEKVAVWIPVTDEQLEDEPAAASYVDQRLTFMIRQRLDSQVLVGNGTTPNILGTENVTGIQTQALGSDTLEDATYKLFRQIREDGFAEPTVGFVAPSKWEDVRLRKTADGQYIWAHPSQGGVMTLWGVPIVETTAVTSTKLVAGDYSTHSLLGVRRGVDVQVTNAHSDFFINGKQAIRADMRVVMVHFRPKAFGNVTGL